MIDAWNKIGNQSASGGQYNQQQQYYQQQQQQYGNGGYCQYYDPYTGMCYY